MNKNFTPVIGMISGIILVIWSIMSSGEIINFIDMPSVAITVLGSFSALIVSFPMKLLKKVPVMLKVIVAKASENRSDLITLLVDLSKKARRDGLLALEDDIYEIDNDVLKSGLQMVVDGVEPDTISDIMILKLNSIEDRHKQGQEVFLKWGDLAPAFGMLGTLIGLIVMLSELDDPSAIGTGMATALVTTFYGSFMANMIFLPIANNLKVRTDEEFITGEMIIQGILEIQAGSNPRILEEKLITYLSPTDLEELKNLKQNAMETAENYE